MHPKISVENIQVDRQHQLKNIFLYLVSRKFSNLNQLT